jgi:DNA-binding transcriptional MerR regulator
VSERRYTLDELAGLTGLKPRTIRHYIQQDLLLGPDSLGRSATYSDYHIKRLEVITDLRSRRFRIEDIRKALSHAQPDEDIRVAVIPLPGMPTEDAPPHEDDDSALSFVRSRQQPLDDEVAQSMPPSSGDLDVVAESSAPYSPPSSSGPIEELLLQLRAISGQRSVTRRTRGQSWVHFAATSDFEIHVRGQVPAEQQVLFEQIADHIRHILLGGDPHA